MLLFRLFAPVFWLLAARHFLSPSADSMKAGTKRSLVVLSAVLSVILYLFLHAVVPVDYQMENLLLRYMVVEWLPLLITPLLLMLAVNLKSESACSLDTALVLQWGALLGVNWVAALMHSAVWQPYAVFVYPVSAMALSLLPPLLFFILQPLRGWKFVVWPGVLFFVAAAGGIEFLFRVQRWVLGTSMTIILSVLVLVITVTLNHLRTAGK